MQFHGSKINELYLVEVDIKNTGTRDIVPDDFATKLNFTTGARILSIEGPQANPTDLAKIHIVEFTQGKIVLSRGLLKKGETISIKLVLESPPKLDFDNNRITNVDVVKLFDQPTRRARLFREEYMVPIVGSLICLSLIIFGIVKNQNADPPNERVSVRFSKFPFALPGPDTLTALYEMNIRNDSPHEIRDLVIEVLMRDESDSAIFATAPIMNPAVRLMWDSSQLVVQRTNAIVRIENNICVVVSPVFGPGAEVSHTVQATFCTEPKLNILDYDTGESEVPVEIMPNFIMRMNKVKEL